MSNAQSVDFVRYQVRTMVTAEGLFSEPVGGNPGSAACGPWMPAPKVDAVAEREPWRTLAVSSFQLWRQNTGCPVSAGAPGPIGEPTAWPVAIGRDSMGRVYVTCGVWGAPSLVQLARCWTAFAHEHGGQDFTLTESTAFYLIDLWGWPGAGTGGKFGNLLR